MSFELLEMKEILGSIALVLPLKTNTEYLESQLGSAFDEDLVRSGGQFVGGRLIIVIVIIICFQTKLLSFFIFNFKVNHYF